MPVSRFGSGLSKIKKGLFSTGLSKIKAGYMYESGAYVKVCSFGSKISYYDGNTLLGVEYVGEGEDVLHPSITMATKTNKTFVGWATSNSEDDWVGELVATGQPMNLYAIYIDNTKTLSVDNVWLSGSVSGSVRSPSGRVHSSYSFNLLKKGRYGTAMCTLSISGDNHGTERLTIGEAWLDSNSKLSIIAGESKSASYSIGTGGHGVYLDALAYDNYWQVIDTSVSIVLSSPITWS